MKNNYKIIFLVAAVIAIVAVFMIYNNINKSATDVGDISISQSTLPGCYVATLAKDVYVLKITKQDGDTVEGMLAFNNFEKDSSSGSFTGSFKDNILLGEYSFDSEGMHSERQVIFKKVGDTFVEGFGDVSVQGNKEVFNDLSTITYDTKLTFVKNANCAGEFKDSHDTVTFKYNTLFSVAEGNQTPTFDWRLNSKQKGLILARVTIPRTFLPRTNFSGAYMTIGRSTDPVVIKNCGAVDITNGEKSLGTTNIDGHTFNTVSFSGAGAGNLYGSISSRGIVDGDCYVVEYTIHSTNIGNYSPDQGITEFNKDSVSGEFENILTSLKFLVNSN